MYNGGVWEFCQLHEWVGNNRVIQIDARVYIQVGTHKNEVSKCYEHD